MQRWRRDQVCGLGGVFNSAEFILPLGDAGSGAVDTSLARGVGPATFTRATTAWTKLSSGLWASVASGTARSCYIGATTAVGAYGGYFAEGAGTQLVTPTANIRDMTGVGWDAVTMTVAKTGTGIDGVVNACTRLTATGAAATVLHLLVAAASDRTYSCFIRRVTGTGTVKLVQGATKSSDFAASINTSTYTRLVLDATVDVTLIGYGIELGTSGDVIEVDFNQFEAGAFATSPMDAAGAVRNSDVLTYPFAGNALAATGTCYADLSTFSARSTQQVVVSFTTSNGPMFFNSSVGTRISISDGTTAATKTGLTDMLTGIRKRATSWGTALNATGDGATVETAAFDGDMGSAAVATGCFTNGASSWYGTLKEVHIWQSQLADATLQALTA